MRARCGGLAGRGHLPENRYRSWRTVECGEKYSRFVKSRLSNRRKAEGRDLISNRISNRPPSSIPRGDIQFATADSWGRGACRSWDRSNTGSRPFPGGHSFPRPQMSRRSCTGPGTFATVLRLAMHRLACSTSPFFHRHHRLLLALVRLQNLLSQPQRFRSDFHEFIIRDELDRLFQIQLPEGHQPDGLVSR